jgi:hypothetical protein
MDNFRTFHLSGVERVLETLPGSHCSDSSHCTARARRQLPKAACAVPKLVHGPLTCLGSRSLGCSAVFAYQSADGAPVLDPGGDVNEMAGLVQRRSLLKRLVRPVTVVVPREFGQDLAQVLLAEDQHVIEALPAQRAREPLRKGVRRPRTDTP